MTIELLEPAASLLGDLRERVVFLGGSTVGLWFTDPAARAPRTTYDVDVVAEVATLAAYEEFQRQLRRQGFAEDVDSGVTARYRHRDTGLILDALPLEPRLAGLNDPWLARATGPAVPLTLPSGTEIRAVPPAWLVVTKLQAFTDRGNNDCLGSRDFEDLILLIDSRIELADEIDALPNDARSHVRRELRRALGLPSFQYGVEGALATADARARTAAVTIPRLEQLAAG